MASKQAPIHSGFGAHTEAHEVVGDVAGRIAIVTGGAAGIGLATTRALAEAGATVIVGARSSSSSVAGMPRVEVVALDLLDPASIDAFAGRFRASGRPLHMLIGNAGIMAKSLTRDARGYEVQFATNHLGHFQLAARLWPALREANGARVVAVSSCGHRHGAVDFEDTMSERRPYDPWLAYGMSKTANALFALALDRRGEAHGVRAFSLHPGTIDTGLLSRAFGPELDELRARLGPGGFKTPSQGAATSVWCASSAQLAGMGGVYCEDCDIAAPVADPELAYGVKPWAMDPEAAERLWGASERWTVPFTV